MSRILDERLIRNAIRLTEHSAIAIMGTAGATWGPRIVTGYVKAHGMEQISYTFHAECKVEWNPDWGTPEKFSNIAEKKLGLVMKHKMNTSVIAALYPALLEEGDFMYAGGAYREGIGGASASGAKSWADETISEILLANINMLVQLEKDRRIQADQMEI